MWIYAFSRYITPEMPAITHYVVLHRLYIGKTRKRNLLHVKLYFTYMFYIMVHSYTFLGLCDMAKIFYPI